MRNGWDKNFSLLPCHSFHTYYLFHTFLSEKIPAYYSQTLPEEGYHMNFFTHCHGRSFWLVLTGPPESAIHQLVFFQELLWRQFNKYYIYIMHLLCFFGVNIKNERILIWYYYILKTYDFSVNFTGVYTTPDSTEYCWVFFLTLQCFFPKKKTARI